MKLPAAVFYLTSQCGALVAKIPTASLKCVSVILCFFFQLETKTGKASAASLSPTDTLEAPDLKVALKREREEHQHLLAESYAAVMDLTKQVPVKHLRPEVRP